MFQLCDYSDIFGKPNEGVHKYRIFDIAIVDLVFTVLAAIILYYTVNRIFNKNISFMVYLIILFVTGIILHRVFCVRTTVDKLLFQ